MGAREYDQLRGRDLGRDPPQVHGRHDPDRGGRRRPGSERRAPQAGGNSRSLRSQRSSAATCLSVVAAGTSKSSGISPLRLARRSRPRNRRPSAWRSGGNSSLQDLARRTGRGHCRSPDSVSMPSTVCRPPGVGSGEDQVGDELRVIDGETLGHEAAHRPAQNVRLGNADRPHQPGRGLGERVERVPSPRPRQPEPRIVEEDQPMALGRAAEAARDPTRPSSSRCRSASASAAPLRARTRPRSGPRPRRS